jgi:DNA mismatch repair protein MutS2
MSSKEINIEELLKNIYDNKVYIEKEKIEIEKKSNQLDSLRKSLEHDSTKIKNQEKELIENAKIKARNILLDAKEESTKIIRKLNKSENIKDANFLRNILNDKIKQIQIDNVDEINNNSTLTSKDISVNMDVYVKSFKQNGIVISNVTKSNEVLVQIGNIKTSVNINNLEKIPDSKKHKNKSTSNIGYNGISKSKNIKSEINVIGLNVEEATFVVDKFLDDCSLAKLQTVRIVHGKGTGKLREGIHNFLKKQPIVNSFRLGTYGEGEMGVTIVELKK